MTTTSKTTIAMTARAPRGRLSLGVALGILAAALTLAGAPLPGLGQSAAAQTTAPRPERAERPTRKAPVSDAARSAGRPQTDAAAQPMGPTVGQPVEGLPPERLQTDVSSRSVPVTSSYSGVEIVVFGAVEHSRKESPQDGYYDVVIVLEGRPQTIISRRKSRVGPVWLNTSSLTLENVPSYYAIVATRPIEEIADSTTLQNLGIGFDRIPMTAKTDARSPLRGDEVQAFKEATIRLKQSDGLYAADEYGVAFIGRSLFRAQIHLPPNIPVGPLKARTFLFHDGAFINSVATNVVLEREGVERFLHGYAFNYPVLYGISTVFLAIAAGLIASQIFKKGSH